MKKIGFFLLFLGFSCLVLAQESTIIFHPINGKRPSKTYFKNDLVRMKFRTTYDLVTFAASEFDVLEQNQLAVLLNGDFVGQIDVKGHFLQVVDDKMLLDIPMDSVRFVEATFEPAFQTRHSTINFFGKINVFASPPLPPDTVAWNRFEPTRYFFNIDFLRQKAKKQALASIATRAGWFLGKVGHKNSIQAGIWLEIPLSRRFALETEFAFSHKRELLQKFVRTPFDDFIYELTEWRSGVDLKYYMTKRYHRPYVMVGGFATRGNGNLLGGKDYTPLEYLGSRKGYGVRAALGFQFSSGFYLCISKGVVLGDKTKMLPFQYQQGGIAFGWMLGKA
jgi:hypothetical protein